LRGIDRWQDEQPPDDDEDRPMRGKDNGSKTAAKKFADDHDIPRLEPGWSERKVKQSKSNNAVDDHPPPPVHSSNHEITYFEYDTARDKPGQHWPPQHPDHLPTEYKISTVGENKGRPPFRHHSQPRPEEAGAGVPWQHETRQQESGLVHDAPFQPSSWQNGQHQFHRESPPLQPDREKRRQKFYFAGEGKHWRQRMRDTIIEKQSYRYRKSI
jgi:hypothetical protein